MASRLQRIFLSALLILPAAAYGQSDKRQNAETPHHDPLDPVVGADIERRHIDEDMLDSENFELEAFTGILSIEDFGSAALKGVSLSYHINEDFFIEGVYGASKAQKTSYELLSGSTQLLSDAERDYRYYSLNLGYKIFPGQVYMGENNAFNTHFYVTLGGGNTDFAGNRYFTYSLGAGYRLYATDWLAIELGMRDHLFSHELFGKSRQTNNVEGRLGLSVFF